MIPLLPVSENSLRLSLETRRGSDGSVQSDQQLSVDCRFGKVVYISSGEVFTSLPGTLILNRGPMQRGTAESELPDIMYFVEAQANSEAMFLVQIALEEPLFDRLVSMLSYCIITGIILRVENLAGPIRYRFTHEELNWQERENTPISSVLFQLQRLR